MESRWPVERLDHAELTPPPQSLETSARDQPATWAQLVVIAAGARSAVALSLYLSLWGSPPTIDDIPPLWLYAVLSTTFTTLGIGLTFGNRKDLRAWWLGGLFALWGTTLATRLIRGAGDPRLEWLSYFRPDAFQAAFLWLFAAHFPSKLGGRFAVTIRAVAGATALVAAWCLVVNLAAVWLPPDTLPRWIDVFLITTKQPGRTYWLVVYGMTAPALPVLLARAVAARGEDRYRATMFVSGLLAGVAPFTVEVLAEEMIPAYKVWAHQPAVEPWVGAVIFGALAIVPFITTYSVLFDRVVEVRVVLRAALQYVLARYTLLGATFVPFVALGLYLFQHRQERIASLATGARPLLLGAFATLGMVAIRLRSRWQSALDRRYFREPYDARDIVTRILGEWQPTTERALASELRKEIDRALHSTATLFVVDDTRTFLQDPDARFPKLPLSSTLVRLAIADPRPMHVDVDNEKSALSRLPIEERQWLEQGRFSLVFALKRSDGTPLGLLAMTAKQSDLPYSTDDCRLLQAMASAAASTLDRLRLASSPETSADPPAHECVICGRINLLEAAQCTCGGQLVTAFVPLTLRGIFRFDQRIGAGGMGVVYRATDLNLHRVVAIKALPRATQEMVSRLRREARAMAAVTHQNLATVHGVETWQATPLIVQEYLAGGTLTSRLRTEPMSIPDILELGITLAEALHHLHGRGVIHCDIKPSNLGFTDQGVVKVLDFGLARVVHETLGNGQHVWRAFGRTERRGVGTERRMVRHASFHVAGSRTRPEAGAFVRPLGPGCRAVRGDCWTEAV